MISFKKIGILLCLGIMCLALATGCSGIENDKEMPSVTPETSQDQETKVTPSVTQDVTDTPTPTAVPTPTPLPKEPFIKLAYETFGRDDVYRIPVKELEEGWEIYTTRFAGDYVLFRLYKMNEDAPDELIDRVILLSPGKNTLQYRLIPDFTTKDLFVLENGTVIIEEWDTGKVHVYDRTLTERDNFILGGEKPMSSIGFTKDGILWTVDDKEKKILANHISNDIYADNAYSVTCNILGEYPFDKGLCVEQYLGQSGGKECFSAYTDDGKYELRYIFITPSNGEVSYGSKNDTALGSEWSGVYSAEAGNWEIVNADSTWFLHSIGSLQEGFCFPKNSYSEGISFIQGKMMCSLYEDWSNPENTVQEFRLYDLEKHTVSGGLSCADVPDCSFLAARGILSDNSVVLIDYCKEEGKELLIWTNEGEGSDIPYFCDLAKDDPKECLNLELSELKDTYGIEITPDKTGDRSGLGDIMVELDLANLFFISAKEDPELFNAKEDGIIRPENMRNNEGAHYSFNPHVFSEFYLKEHGEKRRDIFFAYVDALRAGEDGFKCPDIGSANWASGRLATFFFPVGSAYAYAEYAGNGWANIIYKIPKEEFLEKEKDFEDRICFILNDVLEDDYSDLEKMLALYEFMTEYCTYDYDMLYHNSEPEWIEKQSGYRCLIEKQGICWEIACLYQYLLLQCGVDAEESAGMPVDPNEDLHAWNYVTLDGQGYLIDATWGLTDFREPDLKYFLFTDKMREERDGYKADTFDIAGYGLIGSRKKYSFDAADESYSELWNGTYVAFDQVEKCIFYRDLNGKMYRFDYEK